MASQFHSTARAMAHASSQDTNPQGTTEAEPQARPAGLAKRVMRTAWALRRRDGLSMQAALRKAWTVERMVQSSEPARKDLAARVAAWAPNRRLLLGGLLVAPLPVAAQATHPDADLLALRDALLDAWEEEVAVLARRISKDCMKADAEFEAATGRASEVAEQICETPARTLDGLMVKALAVSWCHSGDVIHPESFGADPTSDLRTAASIVADLMQIYGRPPISGLGGMTNTNTRTVERFV